MEIPNEALSHTKKSARSCVEHDAWVRTNESAMMEMMNETNQNMSAHVGGSVGGCEYLHYSIY